MLFGQICEEHRSTDSMPDQHTLIVEGREGAFKARLPLRIGRAVRLRHLRIAHSVGRTTGVVQRRNEYSIRVESTRASAVDNEHLLFERWVSVEAVSSCCDHDGAIVAPQCDT